jgi:hypothetical protein
MPELTPNLGIKKPTASENVSRASFNENWDIIDANTVSKAFTTINVPSVGDFVPENNNDTLQIIAGTGIQITGDLANDTLTISLTSPTYSDATLQNGWVNYGGTEPNAGYTKIGKVVRLRGIIKNGTTTSNVTILTLPSGFRPSVKAYSTTLCSGNIPIRVLINTNGTVNIQGTIDNAWIQLEDITFVADGN